MDLREKAEKIYEKCRHYGPSNSIWDSRWNYIDVNYNKPPNITYHEYIISKIIELLKQGYKVKYGWCAATMIRTIHEKYIFFTKKD